MTAQTPLRPGGATPAGGGTHRHCSTCKCDHDTGRCRCGHLDIFHDLPKRKTGYVRTACGWTGVEGGRPDPCDCTQFTPKETP